MDTAHDEAEETADEKLRIEAAEFLLAPQDASRKIFGSAKRSGYRVVFERPN